MKRGIAIVGVPLALAVMAVAAKEAAPRPRPVGYAFDNPRLLAQQLIWGRLHGTRLLGLACHARGDRMAALAYVDWLDRQWPRIRAAERDLARYYFNRDRASLAAFEAALKLKGVLDTSDGELTAACATLPKALAAPSNDLEHYYAERRKAIRRGDPDFPGATWQETE